MTKHHSPATSTSVTKRVSPSWRWYFISAVASIFVGVDIAITNIYFLNMQGMLPFSIILMAALSSFLINFLVFNGDANLAIRGFFEDLKLVKPLPNAPPKPSDGYSFKTKFFVNLLALLGGTTSLLFNLNSYLQLSHSMSWINMQLALVFSISFFLASFTVLRWYAYKAFEKVKKSVPEVLLGKKTAATNPNNAFFKHSWKDGFFKQPKRWWRALLILVTWGLMLFALIRIEISVCHAIQGFLAYLGMANGAAWGFTIGLASLVAIAQLLFMGNSALWLTNKIIKLVKKIKQRCAVSLLPKATTRPHPQKRKLSTILKLTVTTLVFATLLILSSLGTAALTSPSSGIVIALIGVYLSITVNAAVITEFNPNSLLPPGMTNKVKAITATLSGLSCCVAFYFITDPVMLGLVWVTILAITTLAIRGVTSFAKLYGWGGHHVTGQHAQALHIIGNNNPLRPGALFKNAETPETATHPTSDQQNSADAAQTPAPPVQ